MSKHTCEKCGRTIKAIVPGKVVCFCSGEPKQIGISDKKASQKTLDEKSRKARFSFLRKNEYARAHWEKLHKYPIEYKDDWAEEKAKLWFTQWEINIPNISCSCRRHWFEHKKKKPPNFSSPEDFFKWSVTIHNMVNIMLDKPIVSLEEAQEIHGF
jgi:hypothetical protein